MEEINLQLRVANEELDALKSTVDADHVTLKAAQQKVEQLCAGEQQAPEKEWLTLNDLESDHVDR